MVVLWPHFRLFQADAIASARAIVARASEAAELATQKAATEVHRAYGRMDTERSAAEHHATLLSERNAALEAQIMENSLAGFGDIAGRAVVSTPTPTPTPAAAAAGVAAAAAAPGATGTERSWLSFGTGFVAGAAAIIVSGLLRAGRR